jgi:hypothetical protein
MTPLRKVRPLINVIHVHFTKRSLIGFALFGSSLNIDYQKICKRLPHLFRDKCQTRPIYNGMNGVHVYDNTGHLCARCGWIKIAIDIDAAMGKKEKVRKKNPYCFDIYNL